MQVTVGQSSKVTVVATVEWHGELNGRVARPQTSRGRDELHVPSRVESPISQSQIVNASSSETICTKFSSSHIWPISRQVLSPSRVVLIRTARLAILTTRPSTRPCMQGTSYRSTSRWLMLQRLIYL